MTRRREFLQAGLVISALPFMQSALGRSSTALRDGSTAAVPAAALVTFRVHKVIFHEEVPESRLFAREAARLGLPTSSFAGGDATDLWYHEIEPMWRRQPLAIAGSTRFGPLFVLERLAWDRGMRVLYRAEHKQSPEAEPLYSWVIGPRDCVTSSAARQHV